jgi:GAF domain-containing protein
MKNRNTPQLPKIGATESVVEVSLLDVMDVEDFLQLVKSKTDSNWKELWKETCLVVNQLKAARELLSIGSNLIGSKPSRKILDRLVEVTHIMLNAERVVIMELDPTGSELIVTHSREERLIGLRIPSTLGIEGDVLSTKIIANVPDVNQDPRYLPTLDSRTSHKTRSIICAPILSDGGILGVIEVCNKKVGRNTKVPRDFSTLSFTHNEASLLGFIATNIGLALKQCSLSHSKSTHSFGNGFEHLKSLDSSLGRRLLRLENDKNLQNLIELAYGKLDAERVSIFTYNAANKSLVCAISPDIKGFSIPHDKGFAGMSFTAMRMINVPDTNQDDRHNKEVDKSVGFVTRNLLCAPIISNDGVALGVIQAVNKRRGPNFTSADEAHINEICKMMVALIREKVDPMDSSNGAPSVHSVTLARCIGSMALSSTLGELVTETENAIKINTAFDFARVYLVEGGKLIRAPSNNKTQLVENSSSRSFDEFDASDSWDLSTVSYHITQALQFAQPVEVKSSPEDTQALIPGVVLQQACIIPISTRAYPFLPGTSVLIAGHTSQESAVRDASREVLNTVAEYFGYSVAAISDKIMYEENVRHLRQQFNMLNNALGAVEDFVIILNEQGKLVGCNKKIEDLVGLEILRGSEKNSPKLISAAATESPKIREGMHYSQFLDAGQSPELLRDIGNALASRQSRKVEAARLTSQIFPEGISMDYQVAAVENPEFKERPPSPCPQTPTTQMSSKHFPISSPLPGGAAATAFSNQTRSSPIPFTIPVDDDLYNSALIVVVVIHLNTRKMIGIEPAVVPAETGAKMQGTDVVSASTGVDAATSILSAIRQNFVLDSEVEENIKSIMDNLTHTSRRMSISNANFSKINLALQQLHMPLVNPDLELPVNLFEWEFDVLKIRDSLMLCNIIGRFFEHLFNLEELNVDSSTLARYVKEVGRHYHDRPFHNLQHATCVTHFTFMLINESKALGNLKLHQVFAILLSAVVHDVDHPGNTNLFEINSQSELAIRYNDQSVLENHHCSTAFRIMRKPNMQVLTFMPKATAVEIRKTIISCVMATDMAVHFDLIEETKKRAAEGWKFEEAKDQALLGKILLHAADLSNPVRPYHMTREWASRISIEFNDQVAREQALGMPVLGFMMSPDEKVFCKNEIGFASFVVAPMWRAIALLYPSLTFLVEQIDSNLVQWKNRLEEIQIEEEATALKQQQIQEQQRQQKVSQDDEIAENNES